MIVRRKFLSAIASGVGGLCLFPSLRALANEPHDEPCHGGMNKNAARLLNAEKAYLNLPVKNGAPKHRANILVDGKVVRTFDIELADDAPDWWAFMDLAPFRGKVLKIQVDGLPKDSTALKSIFQSDHIFGSEDLYREEFRPQFHFSARRGWINDPHLVFYDGEYHLLYQYSPYNWSIGNGHWGHAVSTDLVHWQELPVALHPDQDGGIASGSVVVDWNNSSGLQEGDEKVMAALYTAFGDKATQCLAFSNDRGRSWTKYEGNPVLAHITSGNRDPKVFWYEPDNKWVMALYMEEMAANALDGLDTAEAVKTLKAYRSKSSFALFSSLDLKRWEKMSEIRLPEDSECPELFEIAVHDNPRDKRWIFFAAKGLYLVGNFDGTTFTPESGPHPMHYGNSFYAPQTFNDIPESDGRRILIPWGLAPTGQPFLDLYFDLAGREMVYRDMPFNQMLGIPVELQLRPTDEGLRLCSEPVRELKSLRGKSHAIKRRPVRAGDNPLAGIGGELFEVIVDISLGDATEITFYLRGVPVIYHVKKQQLSCEGRTGPLKEANGAIKLRMLVDRTSIDIFGNDGHLYMPMCMRISPDNRSFSMEVAGGSATINSLEIVELKSCWN